MGCLGSSFSKSIVLGHLIEDRFSLQKFINSSSSSLPRSDQSIGSIIAFTSSPNSSFGTPITAQSDTFGCVIKRFSVS